MQRKHTSLIQPQVAGPQRRAVRSQPRAGTEKCSARLVGSLTVATSTNVFTTLETYRARQRRRSAMLLPSACGLRCALAVPACDATHLALFPFRGQMVLNPKKDTVQRTLQMGSSDSRTEQFTSQKPGSSDSRNESFFESPVAPASLTWYAG